MGLFNFGGKKTASATPGQAATAGHDEHFDRAMDWEASRTEMLEASHARAWRVAGVFGFLAVLGWGATFTLFPLKEVEPFLVKETATGEVTRVSKLTVEALSYDELRDKSWLARYVRAREGYNWYTLQDDYDFVGLTSSGDVGEVYGAQFGGEKGLEKVNGNSVITRVKILSIVPTENGTATVRFRAESSAPNSASPHSVKGWVATIGYEYEPGLAGDENKLLLNPLGFRVISYRRDPEQAGGEQ